MRPALSVRPPAPRAAADPGPRERSGREATAWKPRAARPAAPAPVRAARPHPTLRQSQSVTARPTMPRSSAPTGPAASEVRRSVDARWRAPPASRPALRERLQGQRPSASPHPWRHAATPTRKTRARSGREHRHPSTGARQPPSLIQAISSPLWRPELQEKSARKSSGSRSYDTHAPLPRLPGQERGTRAPQTRLRSRRHGRPKTRAAEDRAARTPSRLLPPPPGPDPRCRR